MNRGEAREILNKTGIDQLEKACSATRMAHFGNRVDLCAIVNAKDGACSENCVFCAQSHSRGTPPLPLQELTQAHASATIAGISRFSAVTSGKGSTQKELYRICQMAEIGRELCPLCSSLGILEQEELALLKDAGIARYHHNLETSRDYFPKICSTHTWDERAETVRRAKTNGFEVCSGGIMGIGETDEDRIDLAFALAELEVDSIALNFFIPVQGARISPDRLSSEKKLRIIAMFRLANPHREIRICAGRSDLGDAEGRIFDFGATGIMTGTLLTTGGIPIKQDMKLIKSAGYQA